MKYFLFFCIVLFCISCTSVSKYNEQLKTQISVEKLHQDVDYSYMQLQKFHPDLYGYITKDSLDSVFKMVKNDIQKPLTPAELFQKLAPAITQVRQGHLALRSPFQRFTKKETKRLELQKGLLARMGYVVDGNRLFVKNNAEKFANIKVGTEILKIGDVPVKTILDDYRKYITGDGWNRTYPKYSLARRWPDLYTLQHGFLDSVKLETKYQNEIQSFYIKREYQTKEEKKEETKKASALKTDPQKKILDYNPKTKSYNRSMQYLGKDSTIAYMKINSFSGTFSSKFYKESFARLQQNKTNYLILDVRDNLGGSLSEIHNLYSYLAKEEFQFIKDIGVTRRSSMTHANYFSDIPTLAKPIAGITYPLYYIGSLLSVKKMNDHFYLKNNTIFTLKKPKKTAFQGTVYVLINGSSFSASSILSSKLKYEKRATLVGEETGGANDGTVAGRYHTIKLPNSKLVLPVGLMLIQPDIKATNSKKGVIPDHQIIPTLQENLGKKDVALQWILKDIGVVKE